MQLIKIWLISLALTLSLFGSGFYESAIQHIANSVKKSQNSNIKEIYSKLYYVPIWVDEESLSYMTKNLFDQIKSDATVSPLSKLYQSYSAAEKLALALYSNSASSVAQKMDLELKISTLYYAYAKHQFHGDIPWGSAKAKISSRGGVWETYTPPHNPLAFLMTSLKNGELNFKTTKPKTFNYAKLEAQAKRYREYQRSNKWGKNIDFGGLPKGASSAALPLLRERLKFMGDYDCASTSSSVSDECFINAIIRFQKRHGIAVTGTITQETKKLLQEPLEAKIRKMALNLDRIKWFTRQSYARHVIINIAAFELNFYSGGKSIQNMRVVTGTPKNPTPIFSNTVTTIVLNPYWNVPASILEKEMIHDLQKNASFLKHRNMKLYSHNGEAIDASSVNWKQYRTGSKIPYRIAQSPGNGNALGKIKFLFPNRYAVYMHDTPSKSLFTHTVRAYSHGCIRLQDPRGLLKTFSGFNSNVNYNAATKTLTGSTHQAIALSNRVPIDVIYLTAYVDEKGILNFRNDIYGYDNYQY